MRLPLTREAMKGFSKDPQLPKWMRSILGLLITEVDGG